MRDNRLPIPRKPHVKLKTIAALGKREVERSQRVLGNGFVTPRTAVTKQPWTNHSLSGHCSSPDRNPGWACPCQEIPWLSSPPPEISYPAIRRHVSAPPPIAGRSTRAGCPA